MTKTILITGGHVTPALATLELLVKMGWKVFYVGRKYALEGDSAISQEYRIITKAEIPFFSITTGRLSRFISFKTILSICKIPIGLFQAFGIILKTRPQLILSFGGYVAVPVVIAGWIFRIPIVTHEQTFAPGLANRIIAFFSQKICISWEETKLNFSSQKVVFTGNPIRHVVQVASEKIDIPTDRPILYISGGNLGSHTINLAIEEILETLLKKYTVVHQTGNAQEFGDYDRLVKRKEVLPKELQRYYYPFIYIDAEKMHWLYTKTKFVVGRSGANTISEIIYFEIPALFIPLPWSGNNEQEKNARFLSEKNASVLLMQKNLTPQLLLSTLRTLEIQQLELKKQLSIIKKLLPENPAQSIVEVIKSVA